MIIVGSISSSPHPADRARGCLSQGTELSEQLAKDDAEGKIPLELKNHYTVITRSADGGEYSQVAYFTAFPEELGTIVALFDDWIAGQSHSFSVPSVPWSHLERNWHYHTAVVCRICSSANDPTWALLPHSFKFGCQETRHIIRIVQRKLRLQLRLCPFAGYLLSVRRETVVHAALRKEGSPDQAVVDTFVRQLQQYRWTSPSMSH